MDEVFRWRSILYVLSVSCSSVNCWTLGGVNVGACMAIDVGSWTACIELNLNSTGRGGWPVIDSPANGSARARWMIDMLLKR